MTARVVENNYCLLLHPQLHATVSICCYMEHDIVCKIPANIVSLSNDQTISGPSLIATTCNDIKSQRDTHRPRRVTIISVRTAENCFHNALLCRTANMGLSGWLSGDTLSLAGYLESGEAGGDDASLLGELSDISGELMSTLSFDMGVELAVSDIAI